ncbi:BON domain-containing protein [Parvularcula oceani]|uniref:BON domain-containing protein n=1 Tax=Parvularcula oceani TaxID=1247963 RepID=UPI0004E0D172|nr:BON domain-containing protein [Parvularcula oceani]
MPDDRKIKDDVIDELRWDPLVEETRIGVSVEDGAVTLDGSVPHYLAKRAALDAAGRVRGVLAVADEIAVRLPGDEGTRDEEVARKIAHVLEWNVALPEGAVKARVDEGHVVLTGTVDTLAQKALVAEQVSFIRGVRSLDNEIGVRTKPLLRDLERHIFAALHRRAHLDGGGIRIEVDKERVRLTGHVRDAAQRRLVERAVWATPGVAVLDDRLTVGG